MGETDNIILFIILASVILLVFVSSMIFFVFQYHRRRLLHEKEKTALSEQHLRELFFTKLEIQQQTMQDIGRELHDSVNQKLTLASLYNYQLEAEPGNARTGERVTNIGNIINECIAELRSLSKNLTDDEMDDCPLLSLADNECRRINALNICDARYYFTVKDIPISLVMRNYVHRIMQEFLQNSVKHSGCKNIVLEFDYKERGLSVLLRDDGRGFDTDSGSGYGAGIGLANMKKRSDLLGVGFSLHSVINGGTEVRLFLPADKLNNTLYGI